jgi:hypothetical protein
MAAKLDQYAQAASTDQLAGGYLRWSPDFGQVVKLGSPFEGRTHDGQAEALLG